MHSAGVHSIIFHTQSGNVFMESEKTPTGGLVLTLHKESAEQLISGYRFDFCSQVDISTHY